MDNAPAKLKQNGADVNSRFASVSESDILENTGHCNLRKHKESLERFVIGSVVVLVFLSAVLWQYYLEWSSLPSCVLIPSCISSAMINQENIRFLVFFFVLSRSPRLYMLKQYYSRKSQ